MAREAEIGNIFCSPEKEIVRVTAVFRTGRVDVQVIGGPQDGRHRRMPGGIPDDWAQYPS